MSRDEHFPEPFVQFPTMTILLSRISYPYLLLLNGKSRVILPLSHGCLEALPSIYSLHRSILALSISQLNSFLLHEETILIILHTLLDYHTKLQMMLYLVKGERKEKAFIEIFGDMFAVLGL